MRSVTGKLVLGFVVIVLVGVSATFAQTKRINVKFAKGASSGTYSNTVTGYGSADFYVNAKGGQEMSAKLTSSNRFLYFLVIRDPKNAEAIADDAEESAPQGPPEQESRLDIRAITADIRVGVFDHQ